VYTSLGQNVVGVSSIEPWNLRWVLTLYCIMVMYILCIGVCIQQDACQSNNMVKKSLHYFYRSCRHNVSGERSELFVMRVFSVYALIVCWPPVGPKDTRLIDWLVGRSIQRWNSHAVVYVTSRNLTSVPTGSISWLTGMTNAMKDWACLSYQTSIQVFSLVSSKLFCLELH